MYCTYQKTFLHPFTPPSHTATLMYVLNIYTKTICANDKFKLTNNCQYCGF